MKTKKFSFLVLLTALAFSAQAQDEVLKTKKGVPILPKKGDIGLGISANPFINLVGNLFKINSNGSFNSNVGLQFPDGASFFLKYFVADKRAIRAIVNLNFNTNTGTAQTLADGQADPSATVEDRRTQTISSISLGVGKEFRKGNRRLQAIYGYQAILGHSVTNTSYSYGNSIKDWQPRPNSKNWGDNNVTFGNGGSFSRRLKNQSGTTISVSAGGFIGAEYFLMPQVSIGAELSYWLGFGRKSKGLVRSETWDYGNSTVKVSDIKTGRTSSFSSNNAGGSVYFMFYF